MIELPARTMASLIFNGCNEGFNDSIHSNLGAFAQEFRARCIDVQKNVGINPVGANYGWQLVPGKDNIHQKDDENLLALTRTLATSCKISSQRLRA
jgi:hypothetical protein